MKKAIIVEYTFLTRIVIDEENENLGTVVSKSKQKILDKVNNELKENLCEWYDDEEMPYFSNGNLSFDLGKIQSFDVPITVRKSHDSNLDHPFAIDVEDTSYWYCEQEERDADFERLKLIVPRFSFVEL